MQAKQNKNQTRSQYKRPAADITAKTLDVIREGDAVVGHLTPYHVKWITMYTYTQFNVDKAILAFDLTSEPKRIYVTPIRNGIPFGVAEWAKLKFMLKWKKVERDMPGYIGLQGFTIQFQRLPMQSDYRIEPNETQSK